MKPTFSRYCPQAVRLCLWGILLGTISIAQATITVTSLNDSGPGTLRQAIADAAPGDTINFAVIGTITLTNGQLVITNNLTIAGPGVANLTLNGNHTSRVLLVTNGTVFISSLTISNGYASGSQQEASGGDIANSSNLTISNCCITAGNVFTSAGSPGPGGIVNGGNLTIIDSSVSKNGFYMVGNNLYVTAYWAGGIFNYGTLKLVRSAIVGNYGIVSAGVFNGSLMYATNSTISGNWGTGIDNDSGTLWLYSSTVCSNKSGQYTDCGIVNSSSGSFAGLTYFANSIVAGNGFLDLYNSSGSFVSQDFNLVQNTNFLTMTGVTTHNIYGKNPLLGPLADNGGPTLTHALLPGSPAIDHGSSGGLTTDQRGQPRPIRFPAYLAPGDGSDIGAYELQERSQTNWVVNGSSSNLLFTVNSTNDVDDGVPGIAHCSLREAINAANANPGTNTTMITFATNVPSISTGVAGTITLTNGQLAISKNANINGPGMTNLTVSGNNSNRVFSISSTTTVSLSGLTVANGHSEDFGAGVLNSGTLTISGCVFSSNTNNGYWGGGIYNSGALTVFNSAFSKNFVGGNGGGGGGIYNGLSSTAMVINSLISSNYAGAGGGIVNYEGILRVLGSAVLNNRANNGGGIYSYYGFDMVATLLVITNTTISGNIAGLGGGYDCDGSLSNIIVNSTICSNSAASVGGGIANSTSVKIGNCIIAGNSAPTGPDCSGAINSLDFNLVQNTNTCTITNLTAHNIFNQDPKLGPLAYLGGLTPTHSLRFDSPALDAGNSGGLTTDQRGLPRPIDDPNIANAAGGDGSDIGAYEADPNLRMTAIAKAGNDILLNFTTIFGRNYEIDSENNLNGSWTMVTNNVAGSGGVMPAVDAGGASQPQRFYRAAQLP